MLARADSLVPHHQSGEPGLEAQVAANTVAGDGVLEGVVDQVLEAVSIWSASASTGTAASGSCSSKSALRLLDANAILDTLRHWWAETN